MFQCFNVSRFQTRLAPAFAQGLDQAVEETQDLIGILVQDFVTIRLKVIQIHRNGQLSIEFQQRTTRLPEEVTEFATRQSALAL
jgi:hypothetical protein